MMHITANKSGQAHDEHWDITEIRHLPPLFVKRYKGNSTGSKKKIYEKGMVTKWENMLLEWMREQWAFVV